MITGHNVKVFGYDGRVVMETYADDPNSVLARVGLLPCDARTVAASIERVAERIDPCADDPLIMRCMNKKTDDDNHYEMRLTNGSYARCMRVICMACQAVYDNAPERCRSEKFSHENDDPDIRCTKQIGHSGECAFKTYVQPQPKGPLEDEIRAKCAEIAELLAAKNRAYGNSALEPVRIFARDLDETAQIRVRLDDKLSRLRQGLGSNDESLRDTTRDLIGYLVLLEIARDRRR